jgi:hypothetical protein
LGKLRFQCIDAGGKIGHRRAAGNALLRGRLHPFVDLRTDNGHVCAWENPALHRAHFLLETVDPPVDAVTLLGGRRKGDPGHQNQAKKMKTHNYPR